MAKVSPSSQKWIIFVDTNIYLDFYRSGGESAERQLALLEKHKSSLIISEQVWMEFLKNRQKVIVGSLNEMKKISAIHVAPIVTLSQPHKMMMKYIDEANGQFKKITTKIETLFSEPTKHDPVYKAVRRIFRSKSKYNLKRPDDIRFEIRELAKKRFDLGYPPKKKDDTSIGDAYNWEWIIQCAKDSIDNPNVLIVSRDGDFGATYRKSTYLNDWLNQEFKDRVGRKQKIRLTDKLTDAFKILDEAVSDEEIEEEEIIIKEYAPLYDTSSMTELSKKMNSLAKKLSESGLIEANEKLSDRIRSSIIVPRKPRRIIIKNDDE